MPVCPAMSPGSTVGGRYLIEALAGEGGMGKVYRARDLVEQRPVALKTLSPGGRVERIAVEVQALALLDHPSVVRYVGHGFTEDGAPFLVMEWLEGEALDHRLARAGLTVQESVSVAVAVADALE